MTNPIGKKVKSFVSAALMQTAVPEKAGEVWGVLLRRNIERFNAAVIGGIYKVTTGYDLSPEAVRFYLARSYANYGSCALLRTHPYLLAFASLSNGEPLMREGVGGQGAYADNRSVVWRGDQTRYLVYIGVDGGAYRAAVPDRLGLYQGAGRQASLLPVVRSMSLPVTLKAASLLARLPVPDDMPRVLIPRRPHRLCAKGSNQIAPAPAQMPLPF